MTIKTLKYDGSGAILTGSEISYSYSEDVSSLSPDSISGGSGQITLSAIKQDDSVDFKKSPALLLNNLMTLNDSDAGEIEFRVKKVSTTQDLVSLTGETVEARMNVTKVAQPIGGSSGYADTLQEAIEYYCGLAGVSPDFDADLLALVSVRHVNFIGWEANLWEQLKLLCASTSASETEDIPMEMAVDIDRLKFRIANNRNADLTTNASEVSVEVDNFDASKMVKVTMYKTDYLANTVVKEDTDLDAELGFSQDVSIRDQMQVDAGQTIIKRFTIKASLETVNNPTAVASITSIPYQQEAAVVTYNVTNAGSGNYEIDGAVNPTLSFIRGNTYVINVDAVGHPFWIQTVSGGYSSANVYSTGVTNNGTDSGTITISVPFDAPQLYYACEFHSSMQGSITVLAAQSLTGEYVVVGSDDLPILPAQWRAQGGSLDVSLTENPNEIEIKITAPQASQLEQAGVPGAYSLAPYKIGTESAGGVDYPALYITGTGVFFERFTQAFYTGAADEYTASLEDTAIDSPFITTRMELASRGIAAAQAIAGPSVTVSISNPSDIIMNTTIGSVIEYDRSKYRIETASFSATDRSVTGTSVSPIPDFNAIWAGKTFADFAVTMGTDADFEYVSFNEFTIIPLNKDI
jgi:hypothetical protein